MRCIQTANCGDEDLLEAQRAEGAPEADHHVLAAAAKASALRLSLDWRLLDHHQINLRSHVRSLHACGWHCDRLHIGKSSPLLDLGAQI